MTDEVLRSYVEAIRADRLVGRGSCSSVDECWDDGELEARLLSAQPTSVEGAVDMARNIEEMFLESGLNQRWGEDDDMQLVAYREFMAARMEDGDGT